MSTKREHINGSALKQVFGGISPWARTLLAGAIFLAFAPIGLLSDLSSGGRGPWYGVVAWTLDSGLVTVGSAVAFLWSMRLLWFLVPVLFAAPWVINTFAGTDGGPDAARARASCPLWRCCVWAGPTRSSSRSSAVKRPRLCGCRPNSALPRRSMPHSCRRSG